MTIGELERALLARFPKDTAEDWDNVGLFVGRPADEVAGVLVALDVSEHALGEAHATGANVLVTHHPLAIDPPARLTPTAADSSQAGAAAFRAAELGVSVISLHTNLDRSLEARACLAERLGVEASSSLEHPGEPEVCGLGFLAEAPTSCAALGQLAARCAEAFGCESRVWGSAEAPVARMAVLGGSLGGFGKAAAAVGADVVITGEAGYHVCLDLLARGTSLILLGHDRSEAPFCSVLADACADADVPRDLISLASTERPWWTCAA